MMVLQNRKYQKRKRERESRGEKDTGIIGAGQLKERSRNITFDTRIYGIN
jgi:hypothetical protein